MLRVNLSISPSKVIPSLNFQSANQSFVSKPHPNSNLSCEEDFGCLMLENPEIFKHPICTETENEVEMTSIWTPNEIDYISSLIDKENAYKPCLNYFGAIQPAISPNMRSKLYDWMMEVCSEFMLKRETYHLAVCHVDRFLTLKPEIDKGIYQLVGLVCMHIASKTEEVAPPHIADWAASADNTYTISQIISAERVVLQTLSFKIFPATSYCWLNFLMTQWDSFLEYHYGCVSGNNSKDFQNISQKKLKEQFETRMIFFKQSNQKAYKRFRETVQILDCSLQHPQSLSFPYRHMASGLLYLMVSKYFFDSNYALLYYKYPDSENFQQNDYQNEYYSLENSEAVEELFRNFISCAAHIENLDEICPIANFFQAFLEFEMVFDLPVVCRVQSRSKLESHYEDFLAFQTYNMKSSICQKEMHKSAKSDEIMNKNCMA
ncbi:hypothetical protein SteCoe_21085 [Stentor coeruleus]|uniref:Cyclin-like domain-containing protein n=1 Tax=Stentor coeruleus TaxID=5963 RepID=A0A1R2BQC7_9CILI|nr:hypothetical protein SteCoe_21085 [Stentor coeruleus]